MPEAITKFAVNSTLGTNEFEPLDKIVKGTKGLKASDNFYSIVFEGNVSGGLSEPLLIDEFLKMKWKGSLKFEIRGNGTGNREGRFLLKKNGETLTTLTFENSSSSYSQYYQVMFSENDVFGFELKGISNGIMQLERISIYADVVDLSAFEILYEG